MQDANPGDAIEFDTSVFPPDQPTVIYPQSILVLDQGDLTLDASQAGVILDGSEIPDLDSPIRIVSDRNTITGFEMRSFSGAALHISDGHNNLIQGNVLGGSDYGIGIWGWASHNRIAGNFVGVLADGVTPLANRVAGMNISQGAHDNEIGPDNSIAFNGQWGIGFWDSDTARNTVSQNSVHDNGRGGIAFFDSNDHLDAPALFGFDLENGNVVGATCAQCTVEIFSDAGNEGAIYEGQTVADEHGLFTSNSRIALRGPFLTATATDPAGNSSEFSPHTSGSRRSWALQGGNDTPAARIVVQPYQQLADNRMSTFHLVGPTWDDGLVGVQELGTKWIRLSMNQMEWETAVRDGWYSQMEISSIQNDAISMLAENGATITYVLVHFDENLHAARPPNYRNEEDVQLFLDHTRLIVSLFRGRIQYYEILNEAVAYVDVEDYISLIRRVVPIIREVDPQAKIMVGGATALRLEYSRDYLFDVLQSDVMPLVDAITFHPLYGESPQYDDTNDHFYGYPGPGPATSGSPRDYYYSYPSLVQDIKDVATAHGFRGEYDASEMLWRTPANPNLREQPSEYTDTVAAKYYARAIVMNLGMDVVAGITGEIRESPTHRRTVLYLGNVMAGASAVALPSPLQTEHSDIESYSFSLPNGETLIALWTNGTAVDQDPGLASTVVLPGFSGHTVTGVDVLHGYTQELITNDDGGNLVIEDLLIMDYPVILRLTP